MKQKKRKSLKKTLLSKIIIYVAIIIVISTQISIKLASDNIQSLTNNILARESVPLIRGMRNEERGTIPRVPMSPPTGKSFTTSPPPLPPVRKTNRYSPRMIQSLQVIIIFNFQFSILNSIPLPSTTNTKALTS